MLLADSGTSRIGRIGALRPGARRQCGRIHPRFGKRALELLFPMRYLPGRTVTIDHAKRLIARIAELMKLIRRHIHRLSAKNFTALGSDTDFALAFEHYIHLFFGMVVPGHLPSLRIENHHTHAKVFGLDG